MRGARSVVRTLSGTLGAILLLVYILAKFDFFTRGSDGGNSVRHLVYRKAIPSRVIGERSPYHR